ncbi:hypothetical protein F4780DRAFT_731927 [Xylariomycetidae sp. FL0641]|nr:hypothetical protein F4780DRAFT_731927 [Xylariomycetidae sp. FL0641]
MDDADLNQNIGDHGEAVDEHLHRSSDPDAIQSDKVHLDPSRWWFAAAALPMTAGTLGPVASAFSICALVKNWRQRIPPGSDVTKADFIGDPPWLYAVNGVQLFIALIANVFLLLNMTKKVRFSVAQPITIVGWYISSICLIALCATAGGPLVLEPQIDYVWSQAFYYGLWSAILYFIVASMMVVTVWGAQTGHYRKDFKLTTSQRTLMLQTIAVLVYLLVGALVFSHIEGWNYLDGVYWADVTLFTVGFGDFSPQTATGRGLLIPYALIGIISLGLVIGSIRSLMLDRGKRRLDARMLEKKRRQLIRRITRKGKDGILEPIEGEHDHFPCEKGPEHPLSEYERRRREFHLMRRIQDRVSSRRRWLAMAVSTASWAVLWLVGAKIFQECEKPYQGWSYWDGVYFSFTALTTIGYGDLTPVSNGAKSFFVFWSLLALPTQTVLISNAGDTVVKVFRDGTLKLGNITILPGEHGFKKEAKQLLSTLSCGRLFGEDEELDDLPPGYLEASQKHKDEEERGESGGLGTDNPTTEPEKRDHGRKRKGNKKRMTKRGKKKDKLFSPQRESAGEDDGLPDEPPEDKAEYHLILMDEISRVTKHLRHSPPRKYTFKEWAWYLRLIGEDERNPRTHRKPQRTPAHTHEGQVDHIVTSSPHEEQEGHHDHADSEYGGQTKWSWVGHRSPLMDSREEAEWILDRLERRLLQELEDVVRRKSGEDGLEDVRSEERENEESEDLDASLMK